MFFSDIGDRFTHVQKRAKYSRKLGLEVKMEAVEGNVERRLLTVEETAVYLGLAPRSIYNALTKTAKRPFPVKVKRIGKAVRFDKRDLDAYIESL